MAKIETVLMRLARSNGKLANDTYKKIIRHSRLVSSSMSIKNFKEAYHSSKTLPEYRAMLLASLYDNRVDFRTTFRHLSPNKHFLTSNIMKLTRTKINGLTSFTLSTLNEEKFMGVPLAFNQQMREEVQRWQPKADRNKLLTRSLLAGSVHAQKAAFLLSDIKTAIYAAVDMLITNVKANDPLLLYLDDSDKPTPEQLVRDMTEEVGHFNETQERFGNDLEHMTNEFQKIKPFMDKLGIDTSHFQHEFDTLKANVNEFVNSFFLSKEGEINGLYDSFKNINNVITEAILLAGQIDSVDLQDKSLYSIGRLEVIPTFIDYSAKKIGHHRRAAEGSVVEFIKSAILRTRFSRKT